jgi:hypothetical protein
VIQGSGDVAVQGVDGEKFSARVSGSGDLEVSGRATTLDAVIEGSGDMDLGGLDAQDVRVSIDGSGDARVHAGASLSATVNGSGDIRYKGSPPQTKISVNGSGDIRPVK